MIKMPKKGEFIKFKNYEREIKSPFINYADYPDCAEKHNLDEPYTDKYHKHVACSYGHKLVFVGHSPVVMVIHLCLLVIHLVNLFSLIQMKMLFTILLIA